MKTNKTHNRIIAELKEEYAQKHKSLTAELKEAKDLKTILNRLSSLTINGNGFDMSGGSWNTEIVLPDTVLQYVEDILGGNVIKQEGIKCLVIGKDGTVKTGLTKEKADKGYTYKLVRD
jgi:exopolysaccharide biosynthesis protein